MSLLRAATILSKTEQGLWQAFASHGALESSTTLFSIHAPQSSLSSIFSQISGRFRSNNIGCLSASLSPSYDYSISYLNIPRSINHRIWRSTIPGDRSQVGKWYSPEQRTKEAYDLSSASNDSNSSALLLPPVLEELKHAKNRISGLIYFTDNAPGGLRESLRRNLSLTPQLGLIAAPTPFITGRPFTLFQGEKFYSDGAIGIAIMEGMNVAINTDAQNLEKLMDSPLLTVTSASANLIYELDGKSAARSLGHYLSAAGRNKSGHELLSSSTGVYLGERDDSGEIFRVFSISGGSFHSGQILLEGDVSPSIGTKLELLAAKLSLSSPQKDLNPTARFICLPSTDEPDATTSNVVCNRWTGDVVDEPEFIAASESGFILNEGKDATRAWISSILYTQGVASFTVAA